MTRPGTGSGPRRRWFTVWAHRHRAVVGFGGAVAAAGMAAAWLVVVPAKADQTNGLQELAIRWGHPLCWAFLALAGVLFAAGVPKRIIDGVLFAAAGCYAAFVAGMVL